MAENTISISELDEAESLNDTDKIIVETADGESLAVKLADIHEAIGTSIDQISVAATQGAVGATPAASINELTGSTDQHKKYGINFTIPKLNDIASVSKTESDQNAGTNTLTITLQDGNSYTLNVKNGAKGDTGAPFTVAHVYSSIAAMNAAYATDGIAQGAFVVIDTGSVEDADTGKLYIKGESAYEYLTDLSGATGMTGPTGATGATGPTGAAAGFGTPTATVDNNVGTPAVTVTASGPDTAKVFNFAFSNLKGQTGDTETKTFTYIVNSDASLKYWLTNGTSGTSSGGNDFTSVLIKKGTYSVNYATTNLSTIGTKYVEGETGNIINNYNVLFHDMANYSGYDPTYCFENLYIVNHLSAGSTIKAFRMVRGVHNCKVDVSATDASTTTGFGYYSFDNCYNISEVGINFIDGGSFNAWQQGLIAGFYSCQRLSRCTVNSDWNTTSGDSSSILHGFNSCTDVTNCRISAYKMGHGFSSCRRVLHCMVAGYSITDKYGSSYASATATSTYACADTPNGGWNS